MTQNHKVRVYDSSESLPRDLQLAWKIAEVAADPVDLDEEVADMIANRIIDNAAVAAGALNRAPVIAARDQALAHPVSRGGQGASVYGLNPSVRTSPEWAAWVNGVAVRELDYHDTFLAADYSHPGDNIPAVLAVAQHLNLDGEAVARSIATAYEIQISLVKAISLHAHKIDHVAHLGPSVAAALGTLLKLDVEIIYHAVGQALHTTTATRQSRKGEISSWKAYAPAFAAKVAIEAVDRAMRGQTSPSPIYEGEDGVIAWLLDGSNATYDVRLPKRGTPKRAILESYTKEHSAEYQAQALIDLARRFHHSHPDLRDGHEISRVTIYTSHHTHFVIGSGSGDPQKYDPTASRETLDHSAPYIFAVALQDGHWHHIDSYSPERAQRHDTVRLWQKIRTVEDVEWTRRYHSQNSVEKAFGARVEIELQDGQILEDEISVADAHPLGAMPFNRRKYIEKFQELSREVVAQDEAQRFLNLAERVSTLSSQELQQLNFESLSEVQTMRVGGRGIF